METYRVAVISDTHGILRPECLRILETCEAILHAGDVGRPEVLARLREIAHTYAVRGNVDREWAEEIPVELDIDLHGFHFYMVHNKKQIRQDLTGVDIVVYGHSHKYEIKTEGNITYLNPGSCGTRRFRLPVTAVVLTIFPGEHRFEVEKIDCLPEPAGQECPGGSGGQECPVGFPRREMDRLIRKVIKEMKAGRGVAEIANRVREDRALVEQICRIYATHPGVDVDGILNRMECKDL